MTQRGPQWSFNSDLASPRLRPPAAAVTVRGLSVLFNDMEERGRHRKLLEVRDVYRGASGNRPSKPAGATRLEPATSSVTAGDCQTLRRSY